MNELGQCLKGLREEKGWSKTLVAEKLGLKNMATYANWEYGTRLPDAGRLKELANLFDVSTDYLLGNTNKKHYYDLTEKDEIDIAEQAEQIIKGIQTSADVNFYGEPATKEQMESMRDIIETGLRINKEKAKKKFTPKKYRDNGAKGGD